MTHEPLVVVGLACRFPRGEDEWEYWRLLAHGADGIDEVPADRWDYRTFYDPNPGQKGKMCTRWGGFLRDIDGFDADLFGVPSHEAARMDPQQRLTMEVAWEAIEDAGMCPPSLAGTDTGVVLGIAHSDYNRLHYRDLQSIDAFNGTNTYLSVGANRLSFALDLRGPSLGVDTACSSSLYALYVARLILEARRADCVLVGGTNLNLSPEEFISLSHAGLMARDGRCKTFDASADGYVRGEGCAFVVLRRRSDAIRDGNRIRATIDGVAVNVNGRTNGLTAPRGGAQKELLQRAWQDAGLDVNRLGMVEVHGTGTLLGDRIEAHALAEAVRESSAEAQVWVGTAKTNVGHLEAASGMAGLVKVILAMEHERVPPHRNLTSLAAGLPIGQQLRIPLTLEPWPLAATSGGVSAFGFGGANAHVVVGRHTTAAPGTRRPDCHAFMLSARNDAALQALAARLREHLQSHALDPTSVARTLAASRAGHRERLAIVCSSLDELGHALAGHGVDAGSVVLLRGHKQRRAPKLAVLPDAHLHEWSARLGLTVKATLSTASEVEQFLESREVTAAPSHWVVLDPAAHATSDVVSRARELGVHLLQGPRDGSPFGALLTTLMQYWVLGGEGCWQALFQTHELVSLPGYPFQRERYHRAPFRPRDSAAPLPTPPSDATGLSSETLMQELRCMIERTVGERGDIDPQCSLREHGLDSLALVSLQSDLVLKHGEGIEAVLDASVPLTELAGRIESHVRSGGASARVIRPAADLSPACFDEYQALAVRLDALGPQLPFFTPSDGVNGATTVVRGRELVNFSSYNYLDLSGHPEVSAAACEAISHYGTSVSASRIVSGERPVHAELESAISSFLGAEDALVFVSGHATNVSVVGHLAGPDDLICHDELIHNSCMEGIARSGAFQRPFRHNDAEHLETILRAVRQRYRRAFVLVEGVYSMDGDVAPLAEIVRLAKQWQCVTMVDEAHSIGTLGASGGGIGQHCGVAAADVDIWMGTLSKSLASCGGYIAGRRQLIDYLKYTCPGFVYSVGMTPSSAAAALAALRVLRREPQRCLRLQANADELRRSLRGAGWDVGRSAPGAPIVPLILGSTERAIRASRRLMELGVYALPVVPPAVAPEAARLRFFVSAAHTPQHMQQAVSCLGSAEV